MKYLTTKKAMRENYSQIIGIGYCNAQHLLNWETPIAYSAGESGWACDYYVVDGVLISTGYQPIKTKNARSDYEFIHAYDTKAQSFFRLEDSEERATKARELLQEFVLQATK